jgi:predicted nucleotidyltransferase component of viral defense system
LKGGTYLSKVDLGYHRMSEDVDLIIPGQPSPYEGQNARLLDKVATWLAPRWAM